MLLTWFLGRAGKKKLLSRDLSEVWQGKLTISIEGVGMETCLFNRNTLAFHVAVVSYNCSGRMVTMGDPKQSPWEIVYFDVLSTICVERNSCR